MDPAVSEERRSVVMKTALLLVLLEGWTAPLTLRARLGVDVQEALAWLWCNGYLERGDENVVRWRSERTFEGLWSRLVPERGCPIRLCGKTPVRPHVQELR